MYLDLSCRPGLDGLKDRLAVIETCMIGQYDAMRVCPGWSVLDVGAGIGEFSAHAVRLGASKVVAYECDLFCGPALLKNAVRYGFEVRLEKVVDLNQLPNADLLKLDIEGGEFGLLVDRAVPFPRVIMEYHRPYGDLRVLMGWLRQSGFCLEIRPNRVRDDVGILAAWRLRAGGVS